MACSACRFAVAPNFLVNEKDYLVPMVVEEPSIVAGVSQRRRQGDFVDSGGFSPSTSSDPVLIGQVQIVGVDDPDKAVQALYRRHSRSLARRSPIRFIPTSSSVGAVAPGDRITSSIDCRMATGPWCVHLLVDTRDAMGANIVNTMCEGIAARESNR